MRIVDGAIDQIVRPQMAGPLQIVDTQKSWDGSTMNFSLSAKMGLFSAPIKGVVIVTDKDITIDCELPGLLGKLIPEQSVRSGIESRIRGLLT